MVVVIKVVVKKIFIYNVKYCGDLFYIGFLNDVGN